LIPKLKKFEEQKNEIKDERNSSPPAGILPANTDKKMKSKMNEMRSPQIAFYQ